MNPRLPCFHLGLVTALALLTAACAAPRELSPTEAKRAVRAGASSTRGEETPETDVPGLVRKGPVDIWGPAVLDSQARALPVGIRELEDGSVKVFLPPGARPPVFDVMSRAEARSLREALSLSTVTSQPRLRLVELPGSRRLMHPTTAQAGLRVREEILAGFGPGLLPLPEAVDDSPLLAALKMSPRFMGEGFQQAAEELFNSPLFIHGVYFSVLLYFSAWLAPEPFFSKGLAAALTVRLALLVGVVELGRVAQACMRLYQEAGEARTPRELEEASARFGAALGGTGFRVLVLVATMGLGRLLPSVPEGGIGAQVRTWVAALEGGPSVGAVTTAQVVADGTLVVTGTSVGLAVSSACSAMGLCTMASTSAGSDTALSTRYGPPHTRSNPPHNEAIEEELAVREGAGHIRLGKNKAQTNAANRRVFDPAPAKGVRFRRPDASSVRPDGVRHNTNYVSNPKDMSRELEAFEAMQRADPRAIHELYTLDGTLVRRYVPPGVGFP